MQVCDREEELRATASHRQLLCLPAFLLMQSIEQAAGVTNEDDGPPPAPATVKQAVDLIAEVPLLLLGNPSVNSFFGEIHLSWTKSTRQVALIFLPDRVPLVHHYYRAPGHPSTHDIEPASADRVAYWLRWLRS